jgi:hypothetical protein
MTYIDVGTADDFILQVLWLGGSRVDNRREGGAPLGVFSDKLL